MKQPTKEEPIMLKFLAKTSLLLFAVFMSMTVLMSSLDYCGFDIKQSFLSKNNETVETKIPPAEQVFNVHQQTTGALLQDTLNTIEQVATVVLHFDNYRLSYDAKSRLEQVLQDKQVNRDSQIVVYAGYTDNKGKNLYPHITRLQAQNVARVALAYTRKIQIKLYEQPAKANMVLLEIL